MRGLVKPGHDGTDARSSRRPGEMPASFFIVYLTLPSFCPSGKKRHLLPTVLACMSFKKNFFLLSLVAAAVLSLSRALLRPLRSQLRPLVRVVMVVVVVHLGAAAARDGGGRGGCGVVPQQVVTGGGAGGGGSGGGGEVAGAVAVTEAVRGARVLAVAGLVRALGYRHCTVKQITSLYAKLRQNITLLHPT